MDKQKFLTAFLGGISVGIAVVNLVTTTVHAIEAWREGEAEKTE